MYKKILRAYNMERPRYLNVQKTTDGLDTWLSRLHRIGGTLAVDTETSGLNWSVDRVGGISFAAGDTAIYCCKDALGPAAHWLGREIVKQRTLVMQNGKFDMHFLRETFGLNITYPIHDTLIQSFLLDNRGVPGHHLKDMAAVYVDPNAHDPKKEMIAALKAKLGRWATESEMLLAPMKYIGKYAALDAWYTLQLHYQYIRRIHNWPQPPGTYPPLTELYDTERWLQLALRDMEQRGIRVRREFLEKWREELRIKLKKTRKDLIRIAGKEINWNSAPQVGELLFKKLKIPVITRTKAGAPSTAKFVLKQVTHPIGQALLDYREDSKQYVAYAQNLLESIRADGAIHPDFRQTGARTGRLSCANPNLQQQTRDSSVRKAYIPRKGLVLRFADYSQIEMRFAAILAKEPMMIRGFNSDPDFDTHAATAKVMYHVKKPTSGQRFQAKTINFTTLFGGGENQVTETLTEMLTVAECIEGLREFRYRVRGSENPFRALAKLIRQRYFAMLPAMLGATKLAEQIAERRGFTTNLFGRHRYLEGNRWYSAFNSEVQGAAADQAKKGIVALYRELQLGTGEIALMLQIHDEAVYESAGDPRTDRRVLELLRNDSFTVPIIADISGSAVSWQDKVKIPL